MKQQIGIEEKEAFFKGFGEQNLKTLVERLLVPLIVVDAKERVVYINEAGEKLCQQLLVSVAHKPLSQVLFISDPKVLAEALKTVLGGKVVWDLRWEEEQYYEGRVFWRQAHMLPLFDAQGAVEHAVIMIQDITGQMRSEKKLMKSQEHYRLIFEGAPDGILILQGEVIIGANKACERILGYTEEELRGKRIEELSPDLQGGSISSKEMAEETTKQALAGKTQRYQWQWLTKTGAVISTHMSLAALVTSRASQKAWLLQGHLRESGGKSSNASKQ
jgi:PAS domain S-box-containing protein